MLKRGTPSLSLAFQAPQQVRCFAVNEKVIKQRMKSVANIEKITKAMKMVASSKMRVVIRNLENGKNFAVKELPFMIENSSYYQAKLVEPKNDKTLLVPVSSDRGLCGASNSGIVREVKSIVKNQRSNYKIFCLGDKAAAGLIRAFPDCLAFAAHEIEAPINYSTAMALSNHIQEAAEGCSNIEIVYNDFKSVINSTIERVQIPTKDEFLKNIYHLTKYNYMSPGPRKMPEFLYDLYLSPFIYHALLHSAAVEQSARMAAMENASKNAKEMLEKLTLEYNKARQAKITLELCEIISGAAAL
mmetsp:Transcript_36941/g.41999  ORF Transcript_36941/g.41999 Transcript_36941/m.41999 type:complete len:301 (+) Transcript_36941:38-940(+)|eukprot:CAMPEP_0114990710 /NCGR_PEP_ID=MMETSP0216-20121206/10958_1 /TAXON_ID=223996 /ORGANISM="Protocruzia adherens, Strain Boccale" /LENGTH=300 /DNA_ID=CAMNT_0002353937 /DNA_START=20 /DNA_END=922 /DNA_ORIENTATION=+